MSPKLSKHLVIDAATQQMQCYQGDTVVHTYLISTGKNGLGEQQGSECTPRGLHEVHSILARHYPLNSVFVSRQWTGELYSAALAAQHPDRDWILTRIIQLEGLEPGRNRGGDVDTLSRYIYIHGTPDDTKLGTPGSKGCIRMANRDIVELAEWISVGTRVCIQ
ncbi:MAG: L,D-transpeptidase [Gammaproteobacteria bacterium]|nr:L,D-transpeptidase [Gammaproteobacteria bacterium]